MDELEEAWRVSSSPDEQYFDRSQQSAPVHHLTIDTKELLAPGAEPFSSPMPVTTATPIPNHTSPGGSSLSSITPLPSSFFLPSISPGPSCVDTSYDELLEQGYPGSSPTALERRDVLRRIITNEIAQGFSHPRDIRKLAVIQRDPEVDYLPSSVKKTASFVLQCAWVGCNHSCTRPDRLKTHVFTHIGFMPFPCDKRCGDPHWLAHFH